jgi:hypothetical protein
MDRSLVELIVGQFIFARDKLEIRHRHGRQQGSQFAAA